VTFGPIGDNSLMATEQTDAEKRKEQEFLELAERFRRAKGSEEVERLGDRMGQVIFGT
jgi:hypothetical protein